MKYKSAVRENVKEIHCSLHFSALMLYSLFRDLLRGIFQVPRERERVLQLERTQTNERTNRRQRGTPSTAAISREFSSYSQHVSENRSILFDARDVTIGYRYRGEEETHRATTRETHRDTCKLYNFKALFESEVPIRACLFYLHGIETLFVWDTHVRFDTFLLLRATISQCNHNFVSYIYISGTVYKRSLFNSDTVNTCQLLGKGERREKKYRRERHA